MGTLAGSCARLAVRRLAGAPESSRATAALCAWSVRGAAERPPRSRDRARESSRPRTGAEPHEIRRN